MIAGSCSSAPSRASASRKLRASRGASAGSAASMRASTSGPAPSTPSSLAAAARNACSTPPTTESYSARANTWASDVLTIYLIADCRLQIADYVGSICNRVPSGRIYNLQLVLPAQARQRLLDQPVVVRLQLLAQHARRRHRHQLGHLVLQVAQKLLALLRGLLAGLGADALALLA